MPVGESSGAKCTGSVSSKTNLLICGKTVKSTKITSAREKNIEVWDSQTFKDFLAEHQALVEV